MSSAVDSASHIIAPASDATLVLAVTTGSQSVDLSTKTEISGHLEGGRYLSIIVEQDTWVNFSAATGTASATATSGATQTWLIPARTRLDCKIVNAKHWFNFIGTSAGYARLYVSTRNPQATA